MPIDVPPEPVARLTTLLNVISGFYPPDRGEVRHRGKTITRKPLRTVVEQGIVRTFQLTAVFPELTVLENVEVACQLQQRPSFVHEICSSPRARQAARNAKRSRVSKQALGSAG
jgi:branched-chain amino acid transport system ATP-binding protein